MPSKLMGKVTKHEIDGDWHKFTINRLELKSKFEETYGGLEQGMTVEAEYTEQKNGKWTNRFLGKWQEIEDDDRHINEPDPPETSDKVSPEVWDAKDRVMMMESAYKSAAEYLKHRTSNREDDAKELARIARGIYQDILKAKDNVAFVKAE